MHKLWFIYMINLYVEMWIKQVYVKTVKNCFNEVNVNCKSDKRNVIKNKKQNITISGMENDISN